MSRRISRIVVCCSLLAGLTGCSTSAYRFQTANARQRQLNADYAQLAKTGVPGGGYRVPESPTSQQELPPPGARQIPGYPEFQPQPIAQSSFPTPEATSRERFPGLDRPAFNNNIGGAEFNPPQRYAGDRDLVTQTMPAGPRGSTIERNSEGPELIGRVVNTVGQPEPAASIQVLENGANRRIVAETATDTDGRFRVRNLVFGVQYEVVGAKEVAGRQLIGSAIATVPNTNVVIQLRVKGGMSLNPSGYREDDESSGLAQSRSRAGRTPIPSGNEYRGGIAQAPRNSANDFDGRYAPPEHSRNNQMELADRRDGRNPIPAGEGSYRTPAGRTLGTKYANAARDSDDPDLQPVFPTVVRGRDEAPGTGWMTPVSRPGDAVAPALQANFPLPAFSAVGLDREQLCNSQGELQTLGTLKGDLFLLDFFGSWCGPCMACIPKLNQLHQQYGNRGLHLVGFASENGNEDQAVSAARKVKRARGIEYTVLVTPMQSPSVIKQKYQVSRYPTLVLVDRSGRVILSKVGGSPENFQQVQMEIDRRLSLR